MTKRLICFLLCICMCSSLTLFANAFEPLDGSINADDDAQLIVAPTLSVSNTPEGASAVAYNYVTESTFFYQMNVNIMSLNPGVSVFTSPGWMPEMLSSNVIIGGDDREMVDEYGILMNPHRAIALVESIYLIDGEYVSDVGTATMISSNTAITAAHVLRDDIEGWPVSVKVYPAINSLEEVDNLPFGFSEALEIAISVPYYETKDNRHDWGLIRLETPIGNDSGYLGFQFKTDSLVTGDYDPYCLISGYPSDLNSQGGVPMQTNNQYYDVGEIVGDSVGVTIAQSGTSYTYRALFHNIDTKKGQSGSAVLFPDFFESGGYVMVGIHSGYYPSFDPNNNYAVGIDSELYGFMVAYKDPSLW